MSKEFNNQFATQKLREDSVEETSTSSGVGVYHAKGKPKDIYKKKKGERTTGGYIYKDLWNEELAQEIFSKKDYEKVVELLDKIMNTDPKAFYDILQKVTSATPYKYDDVKNLAPQASINENYSKFKKETRLKIGTKQYYEGIKIAERKLKEASSIIEYINKLKTEISESEGEIKENSHISRTKERMTKKIAEIYSKFKSL